MTPEKILVTIDEHAKAEMKDAGLFVVAECAIGFGLVLAHFNHWLDNLDPVHVWFILLVIVSYEVGRHRSAKGVHEKLMTLFREEL